MMQLLPNLSSTQIHPLVVHFPIALLVIAPLFILIGAFQRENRGRAFLLSALLMMCLGTAGTFAARLSGDAAAHAANASGAAHQVLENHEELAETTSLVFTTLTIAFSAVLIGMWYRKQPSSRTQQRFVSLAFLIFYGAGILLLVNTAHQGGRLTHEFGVNLQKSGVPADLSTAVISDDND